MTKQTNMAEILSAIRAAGGKPMLVGGGVRDKLTGTTPKDNDIEVFALSESELIGVLSRFGRVGMVGQQFGVIKLMTEDGEEFDFSLPRRDNKSGAGHKGFVVESDPFIPLEEAAERRDFTINSIMEDPDTGEILDFFGGVADLNKRILRHTSEHFNEDPIRVLRGFQFAGRFDMTMAAETIRLCNSMIDEFDTLPKERIWVEWAKWAEKSIHPSAGLKILAWTGWLSKFPSLDNLIGVPQDPEWHPEGSVWQHTLHVVDAMAEICNRDGVTGEQRIVRMLAALLHDVGKPSTTILKDGRWRAPAHDNAGEVPAREFLAQIGAPNHIVDAVIPLVVLHMRHIGFTGNRGQVRRLAQQVNLRELAAVVEADHSGRPPLPKGLPDEMRHMLEVAEEVKVADSKPKPILMGRHLIERFNMKPSKEFSIILNTAFEAQMDDAFDSVDGAIEWVKTNLFGIPVKG